MKRLVLANLDSTGLHRLSLKRIKFRRCSWVIYVNIVQIKATISLMVISKNIDGIQKGINNYGKINKVS